MSYITGIVLPVPTARKEDYRKVVTDVSELFREYGATEIVAAWGEDVRAGQVTDFRRAVQARDDETVVFAWFVWPDRATADAADRQMLEDGRMKPFPDMPFDPQRMIMGGFAPVLEAGRQGAVQ